jgi:hypothetical protein
MSEQLSPQSESSPDILGDILGKILGSQTQSTGEIATSESVPSGAGAGTSASNSQNPLLSSLLSNPELLVKLPSIISAAKPIIDMFSQSQKSPSAATSDSVATGALISGSDNKSAPTRTLGREAECRNALLCAMKPYLSSDRQNTIDYIVKLSRLGDILKTL